MSPSAAQISDTGGESSRRSGANGGKGKGKARKVETVDDDPLCSSTRLRVQDGVLPSQSLATTDNAASPARSPSSSRLHSPSSLSPSDHNDDDHLAPTASPNPNSDSDSSSSDADSWCLICHTAPICDATILPACLHSRFCFSCILRWISIRRRCPLCLTEVGEYVIHRVRGDDDWMRYYVPPAAACASVSSAGSSAGSASADRSSIVASVQRARTERLLTRHHRRRHRTPDSERDIAFRRHIYTHSLYAKHLGSNRHTGFRACPPPPAIRHDTLHGGGHIAARAATFLRRELHVWPAVDVEFVTGYVVSLMQVFVMGCDEMVKLIAEVIGAGEGEARHLCHELECWLRSGRTRLGWWDSVVQYGMVRDKRRRRDEEEERVDRVERVDQVERVDEVDQRAQRSQQRQRAQQQERTKSDPSVVEQRGNVAARREALLERLEREKRLLSSN